MNHFKYAEKFYLNVLKSRDFGTFLISVEKKIDSNDKFVENRRYIYYKGVISPT